VRSKRALKAHFVSLTRRSAASWNIGAFRQGTSAADDRLLAACGMMTPVDVIPPEALLEDVPPPMRAIAERLRDVVMQATPEALERVRPGWRLIGYDLPIGKKLVYFAFVLPEDVHVHLGFGQGWAMRDPHRMLTGAGITKRVRWLTFVDGDEIDAERCVELVHEAARVAAMTRGERELQSMDGEGDRV